MSSGGSWCTLSGNTVDPVTVLYCTVLVCMDLAAVLEVPALRDNAVRLGS